MIKKLNCIPHLLARLSSSPRLASPAGKFEGQTLATSSVLARGCTRCPSLPYSAQTSRPSEIDSVLSELGFCETLALQLLTSPAFRPDLLRAPTRNVSVQFMSALRPPTPPCRRGQLARWPGQRTLTSVEGSFRLSISPSDATAIGAHHAAHVAGAFSERDRRRVPRSTAIRAGGSKGIYRKTDKKGGSRVADGNAGLSRGEL